MAFKYTQHDYGAPFDPKRCAAAVAESDPSFNYRQCRRNAWKDGWCKQHHPETEEKQREAAKRRYEERRKRSPSMRLGECLGENERLRAENADLRQRLQEALNLLDNCNSHFAYDDGGVFVWTGAVSLLEDIQALLKNQ